MMVWLIDVRIAAMNLIEHRRRTMLLAAAIATVTSLLVLLVALATGIRYTLIDTATTLWTGHINVAGFYKITAGQATPVLTDYEPVAELVRQVLPEMEHLVERGTGAGKLVSDDGTGIAVAFGGVDIAADPRFKNAVRVVSGSVDDLAHPNTVLIFEEQAKKLGVRVGDAVTLTAVTVGGVANTSDCRVVAIAHEIGILSRFAVYVSNTTLRSLYQLRPDTVGSLQLVVQPRYVEDLSPLVERLRDRFATAGYDLLAPDGRTLFAKLESVTHENWTGQKLDVTTWQDELSFLMWPLHVIRGVSATLLLVLLCIVVTGVMNTLSIAVRERTREIGTLRAIGMQKTRVARLFLIEAALLGLFGASAGALSGSLLSWILTIAEPPVPLAAQVFLMGSTIRLALEPSVLVCEVLAVACVTSAAALIPALRAASKRPVDAMAHAT